MILKKMCSVIPVGLLMCLFISIPSSGYDQNKEVDKLLITGVFELCEDDQLIKSKVIDFSIKEGLHYLYENQLPSGEFSTYISNSPDMIGGTNFSVVFDTAFIVHTLNLADNKKNSFIIKEMIDKSAGFLLDNRENHGVWRYEGKSGVNYGPPDTDDTAMVFSALVESNVNVSDETLDYMLNFRTPDGLFLSWINSEEWLDPSNPYYEFFKTNDIDANVNADVLYAYSLRNRPQPGIIKYLNTISKNRSFINGTLYYPSPYAYTYLVTKAYADGDIRELEPSLYYLKNYLLSTQNNDGGWGNDLYTALATVSLINMDYEGEQLDKAIKHILNSQGTNGSWETYSFYIAPASSTVFYGSQELTTSFSIEALIKYKDRIGLERVSENKRGYVWN